jgi:endonuclease/exonuclease/phosphatase (EEP) superfamily protein YafD
MVGIILAQISGWTWYGELASHWTLHGAIVLLPVMVVFRRNLLIGRFLMLFMLIAVFPWVLTAWSARAELNGKSIAQVTVATANVQFFNDDRAATQAMLAAMDVEILALEEVTTTDETVLQQHARWPFQVWTSKKDITKVALLSSKRIVTHRLHDFDGAAVIEALIDLGESPLRVFVIHPAAPMSPELTKRRDRQLAMLARQLQDHPEPVIVLGDFNLTPGTQMWRTFTGYTKLLRAPGPEPATWPAVLGPFGITIDHVLARGAAISELTAFEIPGSDHRGLKAMVSIGVP